MNLRNLLLCLLIISASAGCNKNDDDNNNESQKTKDLSAAAWKIDGVTAGGIDAISFVPPCYLDNLVTFYADKNGKVEESVVVCDPATAGNFTWTFNNDETEITTSTNLIPGGNKVFKLVSVSATTLVLSQFTTLPPAPFPVEFIVTFKHP